MNSDLSEKWVGFPLSTCLYRCVFWSQPVLSLKYTQRTDSPALSKVSLWTTPFQCHNINLTTINSGVCFAQRACDFSCCSGKGWQLDGLEDRYTCYSYLLRVTWSPFIRSTRSPRHWRHRVSYLTHHRLCTVYCPGALPDMPSTRLDPFFLCVLGPSDKSNETNDSTKWKTGAERDVDGQRPFLGMASLDCFLG